MDKEAMYKFQFVNFLKNLFDFLYVRKFYVFVFFYFLLSTVDPITHVFLCHVPRVVVPLRRRPLIIRYINKVFGRNAACEPTRGQGRTGTTRNHRLFSRSSYTYTFYPLIDISILWRENHATDRRIKV